MAFDRGAVNWISITCRI